MMKDHVDLLQDSVLEGTEKIIYISIKTDDFLL